MADYLPPDVLAKIFIRLPMKTLLQCTSVCKYWDSFITGPTFIEAHLNHHKTHKSLLLIRSCMEENETEVYALHSNDEALTPYADLDFSLARSRNYFYRVVGSCDGVVCLSDDHSFYSEQIILWNPMIHKWVRLPPPRVTYETHGWVGHAIGFGFDAASGDYKVVRIVTLLDYDYDIRLEVDIYSLSAHTWKNVSHLAVELKPLFPGCPPQAYVNGAVHWVGWYKGAQLAAIVSFHMGDEVFSCIELPLGVPFQYRFRPPNYNPMLIVIEGLLSVVYRYEERCSIWVMKEYGVSSSWNKQLDIDLSIKVNRSWWCEHNDRIIGLRKDGKLLVEARNHLYCYDHEATTQFESPIEDEQENQVQFVSYEDGTVYIVQNTRPPNDPEAKQLKKLGIQGHEGSLHVESYIPSLVLIGLQSNEQRVTCSEKNDAESDNDEVKRNAAAENRSTTFSMGQLNDPEAKQLKKLGIQGHEGSLHVESYIPSHVLIGSQSNEQRVTCSEKNDAESDNDEVKRNAAAENRCGLSATAAGEQNSIEG